MQSRSRILICDVNELKGINDEHGHDAGDGSCGSPGEKLTWAASELRSLAGQLGGDEFCLVVPTFPPSRDRCGGPVR